MKTSFRQGLISFQATAGIPGFLAAGPLTGFVSLSAGSPLVATIAHGDADYLLKFDADVSNAWGPLVNGYDNYLFLGIDTISGRISHGVTTLEPTAGFVEPLNPVPGQMWFDSNRRVMRVRSNEGQWVDSPRVVVGKVSGGSSNVIQAYAVGSSVGLNVPGNPGFPLLDSAHRPMRNAHGEMLTTETEVRVLLSAGGIGVLTTPVNNFVPVRATESIPRMRLVSLNGADTVELASSDPSLLIRKTPIGVCETGLAQNEVGVITQVGEITYEGFAWGPADFGKPLYCGYNGEITTVRPQTFQVFRVGFVKNERTILFQIDSETEVQVVAQAGAIIAGVPPLLSATVTNPVGEIVTSLSIRPSTGAQSGYMSAEQAQSLIDLIARITAAEGSISTLQTSKADLVHLHSVAQITGLQTALSAKADIAHGHVILDVTGLQAALDSKAAVNHLHALTDITNLTTILNSKADNLHLHAIADVTGLQAALDSKAFAAHTHIINDIAGLAATLANKTDIGHAHALTDIIGLVAALAGKADVAHGHSIAQITGLQAALDSKTPPVIPGANSQVIVSTGTNSLQAVPMYVSSAGGIGLMTAGAIDYGQPGQVIGSLGGNGAAGAIWTSPPTISIPPTLVPFGTNFALGSNPYFSYDEITGGFGVNFANAETSQNPRVTNPGWVVIAGADSTNSTSQGGFVRIAAGAAANDGQAGGLEIRGGGTSTSLNALPGEINIIGSDSTRAGTEGGPIFIYGGTAGADTTTPTSGGHVVITIGSESSAAISAGLGGIILNAGMMSGGAPLPPGIGGAFIVNGAGALGFAPLQSIAWATEATAAIASANFGTPGQVIVSNGRTAQATWGSPTPNKPKPLDTTTDVATIVSLGSALHHNLHYRSTAAAAVTINIPVDSAWIGTDLYSANNGAPTNPGPMPTGGTMIVGKHGTGDVTFVPAAGVTINTPSTLSITKLHGKATLIKVSANTWDLEGNIA